jgi:hypothetical protein
MKHPNAEFNARVFGSLILFAIGGWFAITQKASFLLGGNPEATSISRRGTFINAEGLSAVALGSAIVGLGVMNIAFGMTSERRKMVFWVGAALFLIPLIYGVGLVVFDAYEFILTVSPGSPAPGYASLLCTTSTTASPAYCA